jgi:hypothetical protein
MKRLCKILATFLAFVAFTNAQEQSGVPAKMTVVTGKTVPVFLQSLSEGRLVFQIYKRQKDIPLNDVTKVTRFEFINQFDSAGVNEMFKAADYQGVVDKMSAELKPTLDEYWQFMVVDNNFQNEFCYLLAAYMELGAVDVAGKAARIMMQSSNPDVRAKGTTAAVKIALESGNIEDAEALVSSFESEVGKLYLNALIEQAKENPRGAFKLVNQIISDHANDLRWMPQAEFLNVHLYLDIGLTNSAIQTARQVRNIYNNSNLAADAQKLQIILEEAQLAAEIAAKAAEEEEARARAEVRARAEARAGIQSTSTNDVAELPEADTEQVQEPTEEAAAKEADVESAPEVESDEEQ